MRHLLINDETDHILYSTIILLFISVIKRIVAHAQILFKECLGLAYLTNFLANNVPYDVSIAKLASYLEINKTTVLSYLSSMQKAELLNLLYTDNKSVTKMQKPDKIYLHNPNMHYALSSEQKIGTIRECYVVNQLSNNHTVEYGKTQGDFKIDGKITLEVGGKDKSFEQIADIPNSYILADSMEFPIGKKLPLWLVGFLY